MMREREKVGVSGILLLNIFKAVTVEYRRKLFM